MLFLVGCKTTIDDSIETISIDCNRKQKKALSDYFDNVKICPLETNSECLLGYVTKVEIYNSDYYLLDFTNNCVFQFGADGKFKRKLEKIGRGPDEYIKITDLKIQEDGIYLLDYPQQAILHFKHDMSFVKKIHFDLFPSEFLLDVDTLFIYCERNNSKEDYCFYQISKDGIVEKSHIKRKKLSKIKYNFQNSSVFCVGRDTLFSSRYSNYIYSKNKQSIIYKLDFKEKTFPEEKLNIEDYNIYEKKFPYVVRENIYQNDNQLIISYFDDGKRYFALYDFDKKNVVFNGSFENDLITDFRFFPQWQKGKYWIDYIDSYSLINNFPMLKEKFIQLKNLQETDNPVLIIYEIM